MFKMFKKWAKHSRIGQVLKTSRKRTTSDHLLAELKGMEKTGLYSARTTLAGTRCSTNLKLYTEKYATLDT